MQYLQADPDFEGWASVYYFCGKNLQFCTCGFRWNVWGWMKAASLWIFVLSAVLGLQHIIIQVGLSGLLPGEEAVTRESFVSICWRLIPYWLNNWEQRWGAEVSSMTFELPHFAIELLIILPCCQIICSRLKVLVTPQVNVLLDPGLDEGPFLREDFAPNVLQGFWERRPEQRRLWPRLRSNVRVMAFLTGLTALAAINATMVPLYLERQATAHADTPAVRLIGERASTWLVGPGSLAVSGASQEEMALLPVVHQRMHAYFGSSRGWWGWAAGEAEAGGEAAVGKGCPDAALYARNVAKHAEELGRMRDPEHQSMIPLVEAALCIMRLSCEKYFVLVAIYLAFLLFRDAPRPARIAIRLIARISGVFQKVILFAFPAVCWLYDAGILFSTFVSVVFWGAPILSFYDMLREGLREVAIKSLAPATAEQIDRMGGNCAICWGDMVPPAGSHPAPESTSPARNGSGRAGTQTAVPGAAVTDGDAPAAGPAQLPLQQHLHRRQHHALRPQPFEAGPAPGASPSGRHPPEDGSSTLAEAGSVGAGAGGSAGSASARRSSVESGTRTDGPSIGGEPDEQRRPVAHPEAPRVPAHEREGHPAAGGGVPAGRGQRPAASEPGARDAAGASASGSEAAGWALPCGHCYHHACLKQWMEQCANSGVTPTCPMCQRGIQVEVRWRLPSFLRGPATGLADPDGTRRLFAGGAGGAAAAAAAAAGGAARLGAAGAGAAAAAVGDVAAGEELLDAVRQFAGRDAGLQVVGMLEHQRELQELLHDAPALEFDELLRQAQPMIVEEAAQAQAEREGQEAAQVPEGREQAPQERRAEWAGAGPDGHEHDEVDRLELESAVAVSGSDAGASTAVAADAVIEVIREGSAFGTQRSAGLLSAGQGVGAAPGPPAAVNERPGQSADTGRAGAPAGAGADASRTEAPADSKAAAAAVVGSGGEEGGAACSGRCGPSVAVGLAAADAPSSSAVQISPKRPGRLAAQAQVQGGKAPESRQGQSADAGSYCSAAGAGTSGSHDQLAASSADAEGAAGHVRPEEGPRVEGNGEARQGGGPHRRRNRFLFWRRRQG